jgi:sialate O-acetylesterase
MILNIKMEMKKKRFFLVLIFVQLIGFRSFAEVKLPAIITNHMILQQQSKVALWGWASPNEQVEVNCSWLKESKRIKADQNGNWKLNVETIKAGGPYTITFKEKNKIEVSDVYLGEVWFCSGQSNMQMTISRSSSADLVNSKDLNPLIRMFNVRNITFDSTDDVRGKWAVCNAQSIGNFSAVAYHFGLELSKKLNVPIGLINSSWGGTPAESWVSKEVLEADESFRPILTRYNNSLINYDKKTTHTAKDIDPRINAKSPNLLFNTMVKPLLNYKIKGVIWYQGEANAARAYQYRKLFPALIRNWRDEFRIGNLPFYYVQIAPFKGAKPEIKAEIKEAQLITLQTLDYVGMAVTMDVGDCEDIHPKDKETVGIRLSKIALNRTYGDKKTAYLSPLYDGMKEENNKIRIYFNTESKLTSKNGALREFTIAGEDQVFYPAIAKIEGKEIVVSSEQVKKPIAVRFCWNNCPDINLFNEGGFPASPFRTDNWRGITEGVN